MVRRRPAERLSVPVPGGELAAHRWPAESAGAPVVVAAHGITSNGLAWARVADHLDGSVTLVAPDLRGRAASRPLAGGYGIAAHVRDMAAVLDAVAAGPVALVGHSMGGFVVTVTAVRHPQLVRSAVLVDGGVAFPQPAGADIDAQLEAAIGPAMRRLRMTFPSRLAYREYWQAHPALTRDWAPWIDEAMQYDLVGDEPEMHSSCQLDAVRTDGADMLTDPNVLAAVNSLPVPAVLLWAPRGLLDEEQGLYDERRLERAKLDPERVRTVMVGDTNHYSIVYADRGASVVAEHIRAAAGA